MSHLTTKNIDQLLTLNFEQTEERLAYDRKRFEGMSWSELRAIEAEETFSNDLMDAPRVSGFMSPYWDARSAAAED